MRTKKENPRARLRRLRKSKTYANAAQRKEISELVATVLTDRDQHIGQCALQKTESTEFEIEALPSGGPVVMPGEATSDCSPPLAHDVAGLIHDLMRARATADSLFDNGCVELIDDCIDHILVSFETLRRDVETGKRRTVH